MLSLGRGSEHALGDQELRVYFLATGSCHFPCSGDESEQRDDNAVFHRSVIPFIAALKEELTDEDASDKQRLAFSPPALSLALTWGWISGGRSEMGIHKHLSSIHSTVRPSVHLSNTYILGSSVASNSIHG